MDDRWTIEPFDLDHSAPEGDPTWDCDGDE